MSDIEIDVPASPKCPACGSGRVTAQVHYAAFEHHLSFPGRGGKGLLGGNKDLMVSPRRARLCLECGYILLYLERAELQKVVAALR